MALRYYANAPATTLSASCSNSQTSLSVASVTGLPIQYPFTVILDRGTASEEAVSVTNASGTTLTVTRAIDGTTAFSHTIGATVEHGITAQDIREANAHVNASTAVHGLAGAVVGTTDAQALTNKDLTGAGNTFPTSLATLTGSQVLTNKTIGNTNTINGFTASRMAVMDGTGKLAAGTSAVPTGAVVGTTDTQTLTSKTLTAPRIDAINDTNGNSEVTFTATASAVNALTVANAATGGKPTISATGSDPNITLNLVPKGTGTLQSAGVDVVTVSGTQTLTNKTINSPTIDTPTFTGVGARGTVVKGANESVTSSATLQADDALLFAVPAAGTYLIELHLVTFGSTAGDLRLGATFPTGTCRMFVDALDVTTTAVNGTVSRQTTAITSGVDPGIGIGVAAAEEYAVVRFILVATGTGTFTLMWAQSVSNATATTIRADSHLKWERVA